MVLYKYLPSARVDITLKRKIRFTQYGALNDPFESIPNITKFTNKEAIESYVEKDFFKIAEKQFENHPYLSQFISKVLFMAYAESQKDSFKDAIVRIEPSIVKLLPGIFKEKLDLTIGALSLSKINNHELMWSHYADNHRGYVIGFDSTNSFFNQKKSDVDELRHLRRIEYYDTRPQINLMETNGTEMFFAKSSRWEYEAEIRMLLPLADSSEVINNDPYPIYLFDFPFEAISEIIFGMRMSEDDRDQIKAALRTRKKTSHNISYFKAYLDDSSYTIRIDRDGKERITNNQ